MAEGGEEDLPRDAKIVKTLLKSMGVDDYEPRVVHQFLELWYRYVVDVLTDAQVYSEHAGKASIDSDDIKLAISQKLISASHNPRRVLLELARNRNKIPLPKSIAGSGVPLPPEQDTLINPNYQLAIAKKQTSQPEETEEDEERADPNPAPSKNRSLSHEKTDVPQGTPQRVSFPLGTKRPR
ncbi:hypothetical protein H5410_052921 [Solanum commersonii]|uniref:Transcription initiation factor TFIID subunit 9 n=1 Tax=Solanum commersonii TaxID=4109 RepID=A0A9J5X4Z1_SOLCO|nr:hypothetical protein H5410_052921 [Solanum commersonii]